MKSRIFVAALALVGLGIIDAQTANAAPRFFINAAGNWNTAARSLTVALLVIAGRAVATDYTWTGGVSSLWHVCGNWSPEGFPGMVGPPCACCDRAKIADTTNNPVQFTSASGGGDCDCRTVLEVFLDADTAGGAVELNVTGDTLDVDRLIMKSGPGTAETATLDVDGGVLDIRHLDITGDATNKAALEVSVDVAVSGSTRITGTVDVTMASGAVLDLGRLIITNGKIE